MRKLIVFNMASLDGFFEGPDQDLNWHNYAKIVFSNTLDQADWHNTRLVKGDAAAEVARLKAQPGEDMIIFGSSDLAASLVDAGLVDEIRIIIAPLLLGGGRTIFDGMHGRHDLKLIQARPFASGNVLLYRPV